MNRITVDTGSLSAFYKAHVEQVLLPFWARAVDHEYGGVFTCFDNTGKELLSRDKYTWSQGRFLWLWAKIADMIGEGKLEGERAHFVNHLHKTAVFLEQNVFLDNGNCAFLLTENGDKKEYLPGIGFDTSIYADCFVVLGLAKYAVFAGDVNRFERAGELYARIRNRLKKGAFRSEPYPVPEGFRPHSISMIMLNVSQEMAEGAEKLSHPDSRKLFQHSLDYMGEIMDNFYLENHRIIEMLPADPADQNTLLARHVNPGHAIESMWFVMHTAKEAGYPDIISKAAAAIEKALEVGWDAEYGGLYRFTDRTGGRPKGEETSHAYEQLISDTWDMKLWWPHSEALYATLLAYRLTGEDSMRKYYRSIEKYVFETFPNPDEKTGEWIQIRDRKGKPLNKIAALPVKDPFHILRNMLLIIDLLQEETITLHKQN